MPGRYSAISAENNLKKQIEQIDGNIKKRDEKLTKALDAYFQQMSAYMSLDQLTYAKNKFVFQQVATVLSSGLSFIPIYGPMVSATVKAMITASNPSQALVSGALAAVNYNLASASSSANGANFSAGRWMTGGISSPNNTFYNSTGTVATKNDIFTSADPSNATQLMLMTGTVGFLSSGVGVLGSLLSYANPQKGTGAILIPANKDILAKTVQDYGVTLDEGMKWIDTITSTNRTKLVLLVFYNLVKSMKVGGRGNLLLETGAALEDDLEKYKSLAEIKADLGKLVTKYRTSRLIETLNKYDINNNSYDSLFDTKNLDAEKKKLANHIVSSICLDKAKTIAYVDDYETNFKAMFGERFLQAVSTCDLPQQFKEGSGHGFKGTFKGDYVKATGSNQDRSDHRKDFVMGVYAFHATLVRHLGTFNLSSLPPFGVNQQNDRAVINALVDAFATQWWVTSRAYGGLGVGGGSAIKNKDQLYAVNSVDAAKILDLPYIKPYFDVERIFTSQGKKIGEAAAVNTSIDEALTEARLALNPNDQANLVKIKALDDYQTQLTNAKNTLEQAIADIKTDIKDGHTTVGDGYRVIKEKKLELDTVNKAFGKYNDFNTALTAAVTTFKNNSGTFCAGVYKFDGASQAITEQFLLKLMPTGKTGCAGFDVHIKSQIEKLYLPISQADTNSAVSWVKKGMADFSVGDNSGYNYKSSIKESYDKIYDKYTPLTDPLNPQAGRQPIPLGGKAFESSTEVSSKYSSLITNNVQRPLTPAENKLANALTNVHMGAFTSEVSPSDFNQPEFNKSVLTALKHITALLAKK